MALKKLILGAVAAASVMSAVPASAVQVVFSQVDLLNGNRNFLWARNSSGVTYGTTAGTPFGATPILFSLVGSPVPVSVAANFLLSGSQVTLPTGVSSGAFTQVVNSFTFNITTATSFCYGSNCFNAGDSLLSGTVQNSAITGTLGGLSANFSGSTAGGSVINLSSPLVSFDPGTQYAFNFLLGNMDRPLASAANTSLGSFRSTISGSFSAEPTPTFNVPEPGTWALMIVGMGLVGVARRRRRKVVAA
jgi:hypothetical protein